MSFFQNNKKLSIIILILLVISGGAYYFTAILSTQLEVLATLKEQNTVKENQLRSLEEELTRLPEKENQIKEIQLEINSLSNQIPSYQNSVMMAMDMIQYMDIHDFQETEVKIEEPLEAEEESDFYITIPITLNFTTTYDKTIQLIEEINKSSQIITIESLEIDNKVQEDTDQIIPNDWVEVEVVLSAYYKEDGTLQHPNYMDFFNKEENIFLNPNVNQEELSLQSPEAREDLVGQKSKEDSLFEINLADIYRSGDNYSFSAYSPNQDPIYLGMTSGVDAKISLTIQDNSYTYKIEDAEGKRKEKTVATPVKNPSISITSQIQKVTEKIPVVSIYIDNQTQHIIDIKMRGSELQNIFIYNENGTPIPPGKRVGKIALKI